MASVPFPPSNSTTASGIKRFIVRFKENETEWTMLKTFTLLEGVWDVNWDYGDDDNEISDGAGITHGNGEDTGGTGTHRKTLKAKSDEGIMHFRMKGKVGRKNWPEEEEGVWCLGDGREGLAVQGCIMVNGRLVSLCAMVEAQDKEEKTEEDE